MVGMETRKTGRAVPKNQRRKYFPTGRTLGLPLNHIVWAAVFSSCLSIWPNPIQALFTLPSQKRMSIIVYFYVFMKNALSSLDGIIRSPITSKCMALFGGFLYPYRYARGVQSLAQPPQPCVLSPKLSCVISVCQHISQGLVRASHHKRNLLWNQAIYFVEDLLNNTLNLKIKLFSFGSHLAPLEIRDPQGSLSLKLDREKKKCYL